MMSMMTPPSSWTDRSQVSATTLSFHVVFKSSVSDELKLPPRSQRTMCRLSKRRTGTLHWPPRIKKKKLDDRRREKKKSSPVCEKVFFFLVDNRSSAVAVREFRSRRATEKKLAVVTARAGRVASVKKKSSAAHAQFTTRVAHRS
jgi:hypothetical protein